MFIYTGGLKLFFMMCLLICYCGFVELDWINPNFLTKIRKFGLGKNSGFLIEYTNWERSKY